MPSEGLKATPFCRLTALLASRTPSFGRTNWPTIVVHPARASASAAASSRVKRLCRLTDREAPARRCRHCRLDLQHATGAEHERRVGHIALEEVGAERAFLRDQNAARNARHGDGGAGQHDGLADVRTDDDGQTESA